MLLVMGDGGKDDALRREGSVTVIRFLARIRGTQFLMI